MTSFPMPGLDLPFRVPELTLRAHGIWRAARDRGLVSDEEFQRYEALVDSHPMSWKGWLRWTGKRPNGGQR